MSRTQPPTGTVTKKKKKQKRLQNLETLRNKNKVAQKKGLERRQKRQRSAHVRGQGYIRKKEKRMEWDYAVTAMGRGLGLT